jgi:hypothetical protein
LICDVNGVMMFNRPNSSGDLGGTYRFQASGADFLAACAATQSASVVPGGTYASSSSGPFANTGVPNGFITGSYAAGSIFTLTISDNAGSDIGGIDSWTIGYTLVPEPATFAALGLGAVALIRRRRK